MKLFAVILTLFLFACGGGGGSENQDNPQSVDEYGIPYQPLELSPVKVLNSRTALNSGVCYYYADVRNDSGVALTATVVAETFNSENVWTGQGWGESTLLQPGQIASVSGNVIDETTSARIYPHDCSNWSIARPSYIGLYISAEDQRVYVDFDVYAKIGDPYQKIGNHGFGDGGYVHNEDHEDHDEGY